MHNIKNVIKNIENMTTVQRYYLDENYDLEQDYRNLSDSVDLIRTILDYHEFQVYQENIDKVATPQDYIKPHPMVLKLYKILRFEMKNKGISFKITGNPSIKLFNYSKRLYLMFYIVFENALKYAVKKTEFTVHLEDVDKKSTKVIFKNRTNHFDENPNNYLRRGVRGGNSIGVQGSGYGLSILYELAKLTKTEVKVFKEVCDVEEYFCIELIIHSLDL